MLLAPGIRLGGRRSGGMLPGFLATFTTDADPIAVTDDGKLWEHVGTVGQWRSVGGVARVNAVNAAAVAVCDSMLADCVVTQFWSHYSMPLTDRYPGMMLRYADADNTLQFFAMQSAANTTAYVMRRYIGGTFVALGSVVDVGLQPDVSTHKATLNGDSIGVTITGASNLSVSDTEPNLKTNTRHGPLGNTISGVNPDGAYYLTRMDCVAL